MSEEIIIPRVTSDTLVKIMYGISALEKSYFKGSHLKEIFSTDRRALTSVITGKGLDTDCENLYVHLKTRNLSLIKETIEDLLSSLISYKSNLELTIQQRKEIIKKSENPGAIYKYNNWVTNKELGLSHVNSYYKVLFDELCSIEVNRFMNEDIGVTKSHLEKVVYHGIDFVTTLTVLTEQLKTKY